MSTHSNLSPSKRVRWSRCPGSIREESKYPDERSSEAAIQGTHTHTLLNWCCSSEDGMLRDPMSQLGFTMSDHDGEFIVDGPRAKRVQFALDYVMKRKVEINCSKHYSEIRTDPSVLYGRTDLAGTCDLILEGEDILEIIDYKDGIGTVGAKNNEQMEQYLIGYLAPYLAEGKPLPWSTYRMTIIQPKLRDKGLPGIDYHEVSRDDIPAIQFAIQMQAAATDDPNAPLVPGDEQCKYCKHKGACAELNSKTMASLGIASPNLDAAKQVADKDPLTMSGDQLRELIEAAPLIRQVLEAAEKEALRRLEGGERIAGLKLVRSRGSRQWAYSEDEMVEKLKKFGIPKDELWKTTLISPAQAEKVVWKKKDGTVKQLTERQLKTLHEEYVKKTEGKLTVAPESDERPAVSRDVSSMFGTVGEEVPAFLAVPDFLK